MTDHIGIIALLIGLAIGFVLRAIALLAILWIMIKIQKLNYEWLPLIGSAFLASALDMIPLVGHFIAVPVLLLCIWKTTQCELFPDASFTVALSYAVMRCLGWIMLTLAVGNLHAPGVRDTADNDTGDTNDVPVAEQISNDLKVAETPPAYLLPKDGVAADISVKGVSRGATDSMVTIQYGRKDYTISLGEGTTISTKEGPAAVRFVKADGNNITLSVRGQEVKYALK